MNFKMNFTIWIILLGFIDISLGQSVDDSCSCRRHFSDCNFVNGEKNCTCHDGYVQKEEMCVEACSETNPCENGGECVNGICNCNNDLGGHFCQIIKQCELEDLCGQDSDTECLYDVANKEAFCSCKDPTQIFVKDEKKCRVQCSNTKRCLYGGKCLEKEEGHFCECKPTLLGDFCENPVCDEFCMAAAECEFVPAFGRSSCVCKEGDEYIAFEHSICKIPCHSDSDCIHGAKCKGDNNEKYCDCKQGTSGSSCEKLSYCEQCGSSGDVTCVYNVTEETTRCLCHDKEKRFDADARECREPCDSDSQCLHGAKCSDEFRYYILVEREDYPFCRCPDGTSGDRCQIIDQCASGETDCGEDDDVECQNDPVSQTARCSCLGSLMDFDERDKKCKDCGCGPQTMSCYLHEGKKHCQCYNRYSQLNDTCEKCDCGKYSTSCKFDKISGKKTCECLPGYEQIGAVCEKQRSQ